MRKKYEAILFDLGNVVFQIHFERCFQDWARKSSKTPEEISKIFSFDDAYAAHEIAGITSAQYHAHICKLLEADITFEEFATGWNSIYGNVITETVDLIKELKQDYKIYAFSNTNELHRQTWSEKYKSILQHFDRVFCSSQLKARKPDLQAFEKIIQETKIAKEKFIFVDDFPLNIQGGEKFGFHSILFTDPQQAVREIRNLLYHY